MNIRENISKNILYLRKSNNLTQEELARELHYTIQAVSKWERGLSMPDVETLYLISEIFNVDMNYLFKENNTAPIDTKIEEEFKRRERKFKIILVVSVFFVVSSLLLILLTNILNTLDVHIHLFFIFFPPLVPLLALVLRIILKARGNTNYVLASITLWMICTSIYTLFIDKDLTIIYSIGFILQLLLIFIPYGYNRYLIKIRNKLINKDDSMQ